MTPEVLVTTILAGMIYVLVPGPATLAALSISATQGRLECTKFLGCHLVGDLGWASLAILAIIGVSHFGPLLFDLLGLICGCYLIWLGVKALTTKPDQEKTFVSNPWRSGLILGLTNPKAYPFALAMFTAVFAGNEALMRFENAASLVGLAFVGFVAATTIVVFWTGLPVIRRIFARHRVLITRATGLVFMAFGGKSVSEAAANMRSRA